MDTPNKKAQLEELERELKMRERTYPRWIRQGQIAKDVAEHRMTCLRLIIRDFEERHNPRGIQQGLGL